MLVKHSHYFSICVPLMLLFTGFSTKGYSRVYSAFSSPASGTPYSSVIGGTSAGYSATNSSYAAAGPLTDSTHKNWIYLDAERLPSKDMQISWAATPETNCKGFYIMHSTNGEAYETLGYVPSHGHAEAVNDYTFIHQSPKPGTHYYQLIQEDMNGNYIYSDTLKR